MRNLPHFTILVLCPPLPSAKTCDTAHVDLALAAGGGMRHVLPVVHARQSAWRADRTSTVVGQDAAPRSSTREVPRYSYQLLVRTSSSHSRDALARPAVLVVVACAALIALASSRLRVLPVRFRALRFMKTKALSSAPACDQEAWCTPVVDLHIRGSWLDDDRGCVRDASARKAALAGPRLCGRTLSSILQLSPHASYWCNADSPRRRFDHLRACG